MITYNKLPIILYNLYLTFIIVFVVSMMLLLLLGHNDDFLYFFFPTLFAIICVELVLIYLIYFSYEWSFIKNVFILPLLIALTLIFIAIICIMFVENNYFNGVRNFFKKNKNNPTVTF